MAEPAFRTIDAIKDVRASEWDACANPDPARFNPFLAHAFLLACEQSGSATPRQGWKPAHALIEQNGALLACAPTYLKAHSQGEYVFDHHWADAYERAGGRYYPKLLCAVPFTPVPGPRLLIRPGTDDNAMRKRLLHGLIALAQKARLSSIHINFLKEGEWPVCEAADFLLRTDQQFHFENKAYGTFADFLGELSSQRRKTLRKERERARADGLAYEWITGSDLKEHHWDAFFAAYIATGSQKWGRPYLTRSFFSMLGEAMPERVLLVLVRRGRQYIAGALNLIGADTLYGRNWGAIEDRPFMHFEACYYQAIDFAIAHRLARVEAGAQGLHKLARGYMPVPTHSAHWIADAGFRRAVARYLSEERAAVDTEIETLSAHGPFKHRRED